MVGVGGATREARPSRTREPNSTHPKNPILSAMTVAVAATLGAVAAETAGEFLLDVRGVGALLEPLQGEGPTDSRKMN